MIRLDSSISLRLVSFQVVALLTVSVGDLFAVQIAPVPNPRGNTITITASTPGENLVPFTNLGMINIESQASFQNSSQFNNGNFIPFMLVQGGTVINSGTIINSDHFNNFGFVSILEGSRFINLPSSVYLDFEGCVLIAWLGLVCTDQARCSNVEFASFENMWLAPPVVRQQATLHDIAVAPFVDDLRMAEWWTDVLRVTTGRHVIGPAEVSSLPSPGVSAHLSETAITPEQDDIASRQPGEPSMMPDAVLYGTVVSGPPQKALWGLKERYTKRLFLRLVSAKGILLWKCELPYVFVKGDKQLDENLSKRSLLAHVRSHENELGWKDLGLTQ